MLKRSNVRTCSVEGCENKLLAKTFCATHYVRNRKYGSPCSERPNNWDWSAKYDIDKTTGCWNWKGSINNNGYSANLAHRTMWERKNGKIRHGMQIDHLCRNRSCCNPDHLEVVTPAENSHRSSLSPLRWVDVKNIRNLVRSGVRQQLVARMYLVSHSSISEIVNHKTWKDVA